LRSPFLTPTAVWRAHARRSLIFALLCLGACNGRDWQARETERAEEKIRVEVGGPSAQFLNVQVTGDERTGQICGEVKATGKMKARFIVYIDGTAGPYLAAAQGRHPLPHDQFEFAWRNDCLREGYKPA
jgi:hypothetical protein